MRVIQKIYIGDPDSTNFVSEVNGQDILDSCSKAPKISERLGSKGKITLTFKSGTEISNADDSLLKRRKIIRLEYSDSSIKEFRITSSDRKTDGGSGTTVTGEPIWLDLNSRRIRTVLDSGHIMFNIPFYSVRVDRLLQLILSADYNAPSNFQLGTIAGSIEGKIISIQSNNLSHLEVLQKVCEEVGCEWEAVYDSGSYKINVVETGEVGGGSSEAPDRVIGMGGDYGNRIKLSKIAQQESFYSRIVPVGGADNEAFNIQDAIWNIETSTVNGSETDLTFQRNCIVKNGYPNLPYFGSKEEGFYPVVSTETPNKVTVSGDASALSEGYFALNGNGKKSAYIEDPEAVNEIGVNELSYRRTDVTPFNNLLEDSGVSVDFSEMDGSVPKGTQVIGSPTVTQVTDRSLSEFGEKAVRIQGDADEGIEAFDIDIKSNSDRPYFSFWVAGRVESGGYKIELVDSQGAIYPDSDSAISTATTTTGIMVSGIEPAEGFAKLRIVLTTENSSVILDAWTLVNSPTAYPYSNLMGARSLFIEASKELKSIASNFGKIYDVEFYDPTHDNPNQKLVEIGSHVTVKDEYKNGSFALDFTARVIELSYEETSEGIKKAKARLAQKGSTLYDFFASNFLTKNETQNKPSIESRGITEISGIVNVKDFVRFVARSNAVGQLMSSYNGTVSELDINWYVPVREGQKFMLAVDGVKDPVILTLDRESDYTDEDLQTYQGGRKITPIQERNVDAPEGTYVVLSGSQIQSYFFMDPTTVQLGVQGKYTGESIGRISADVTGTTTSISLDEISEDVDLLNGQKLLLINQKGQNELVTVDGDQTLTTSTGTLTIQSQALNYEYEAENAWIEEPSYKLSSRITVEADRINANVSSIGSNSTAIADLDLRVDSNESAIATLQTDVSTNTSDISTNANSILFLESDVSDNTTAISGLNSSVSVINQDMGVIIKAFSEPTERPSGEPLEEGDVWLDLTTDSLGVPKMDAYAYDASVPEWVPYDGTVKTNLAGITNTVNEYEARSLIYAKTDGGLAFINVSSDVTEGTNITISADMVDINGMEFDAEAGTLSSSDFNSVSKIGFRLTGGTNSKIEIGEADIWGGTQSGVTYNTISHRVNNVSISTNPTALDVSSYNVLLVTTSGADRTIHGISAGYDGQVIHIYNTENTYELYFKNMSGSAVASNRIETPRGTDLTLQRGSIQLIYDDINSVWKIMSTTASAVDVILWGSIPDKPFESLSGNFSVNSGVLDINIDKFDVGLGNVLNVEQYSKSEIQSFFAQTSPMSGYNKSNWDNAYGWGDHSGEGYIKTEQDPSVPSHVKSITTGDISDWDDAYNHSVDNNNPHGVDKADIGLGSVDNYSRSYYDARYLLEGNNLSDLTNASTARNNLDLGTGDYVEFARLGIGVSPTSSYIFHVATSGSNFFVNANGNVQVGNNCFANDFILS